MSELHYTYRVEWSPEDGEWVGLVAELPSLSWLDVDPVEAMRGVRDLVQAVVADMHTDGETPPEPLAERRYSGKVFVRTSSELHRRLTIEAAEQGVSVNQWAAQKLSEQSIRAATLRETFAGQAEFYRCLSELARNIESGEHGRAVPGSVTERDLFGALNTLADAYRTAAESDPSCRAIGAREAAARGG